MSLPDVLDRAVRVRLGQAQRTARLPSLSAAVWRRGRQVLQAGLGSPEPTADLQYRIGSITKTFTAVLVMQLRDEGRLRLDDPIGEHLPPTPVGHLLVRDLLAHLGGLRREPLGEFWEAGEGHPAQELLGDLRADDVVLPSRRAFHYSNVAYGLLGLAVERLRGGSYEEVVRRQLLDPLELRRTTYLAAAPAATGLRVHPFADVVAEEPATDTRAMAGAGQLWSTPGDLCRWGTFLSDPPAEVLAPATAEEMAEPVTIVDPERWTTGHGLGLQLFRRGERVYVGHGGSMPGFLAGLAVSRSTGVVAAVCTNAWQSIDGAGLACDLVTDVLEGDPEPPPPWTPAPLPSPFAELLGTWWWRGLEIKVSAPAGTLQVGPAGDAEGARSSRFAPVAPDVLVGVDGGNRGERLRVVRDAQGGVDHLELATYRLTRTLDDGWRDPTGQ